jgi:hypothetical protein
MSGSPECRVYDLWFRERRPCGQPAAVHVRSGCIHEHVWEGDVCERHAGAKLHCPLCYRTDKHACPVTLLPAGAPG